MRRTILGAPKDHVRSRPTAPFDVEEFLATSGRDHSIKKFARGAAIFALLQRDTEGREGVVGRGLDGEATGQHVPLMISSKKGRGTRCDPRRTR
jgi:hypothetical protein